MDKGHAEAAAAAMKVPTKVLSVEGADHHLYIDNPHEFNRLVIEDCRESFIDGKED
jgi:pimeloyl-ACP methyl ester carboxylesterase